MMMLGLIILGIGVKAYMDSKKYMTEIVRKNESLIEKELKKVAKYILMKSPLMMKWGRL